MKGDFKTKVTPWWVGTCTDNLSSVSEPWPYMGGLLGDWAEPVVVQPEAAIQFQGWEVCRTTDSAADCTKALSSS